MGLSSRALGRWITQALHAISSRLDADEPPLIPNSLRPSKALCKPFCFRDPLEKVWQIVSQHVSTVVQRMASSTNSPKASKARLRGLRLELLRKVPWSNLQYSIEQYSFFTVFYSIL